MTTRGARSGLVSRLSTRSRTARRQGDGAAQAQLLSAEKKAMKTRFSVEKAAMQEKIEHLQESLHASTQHVQSLEERVTLLQSEIEELKPSGTSSPRPGSPASSTEKKISMLRRRAESAEKELRALHPLCKAALERSVSDLATSKELEDTKRRQSKLMHDLLKSNVVEPKLARKIKSILSSAMDAVSPVPQSSPPKAVLTSERSFAPKVLQKQH